MPPTMTRADLVEAIAEAGDVTKVRAQEILQAILGSLHDALSEGDHVELRGFGSFDTYVRRGRVARNPRTGARVDVPEKRIVRFKPGKDLGELLNR